MATKPRIAAAKIADSTPCAQSGLTTKPWRARACREVQSTQSAAMVRTTPRTQDQVSPSVPFVPPSLAIQPRLDALAAAQGLAVVRGNRMCHLLGGGVSKGNALAALKQRLGEPEVKVLALGDSPNDLPLLEVADLSVVVPGADGPHPQLSAGVNSGRFALARAAHAEGWAEAVERLLPGGGTILR